MDSLSGINCGTTRAIFQALYFVNFMREWKILSSESASRIRVLYEAYSPLLCFMWDGLRLFRNIIRIRVGICLESKREENIFCWPRRMIFHKSHRANLTTCFLGRYWRQWYLFLFRLQLWLEILQFGKEFWRPPVISLALESVRIRPHVSITTAFQWLMKGS